MLLSLLTLGYWVIMIEALETEAVNKMRTLEQALTKAGLNKNEGRDVESFNKAYKQGLKDEEKIKAFLRSVGSEVVESSQDENRIHDIDCYVDGVSTSIKAEHAGLKYGDIYFELKAQLTSSGEWVPSWYYTGQATQYMILQGNTVRVFQKEDVKALVESKGWNKTRKLSAPVKASQGGSYRFSNALLGFFKPDDIQHTKFDIA